MDYLGRVDGADRYISGRRAQVEGGKEVDRRKERERARVCERHNEIGLDFEVHFPPPTPLAGRRDWMAN